MLTTVLLSVVRGEAASAAEGYGNDARLVVDDEGPSQVPVAHSRLSNAADVRREMADRYESLRVFATDVVVPKMESVRKSDMVVVEL